jgi:hypothetical protein
VVFSVNLIHVLFEFCRAPEVSDADISPLKERSDGLGWSCQPCFSKVSQLYNNTPVTRLTLYVSKLLWLVMD